MSNISTLYIDPNEPNDIILMIEEYPEFFPRFEIKWIEIYDEQLDEHVRIADYSNENYSFFVERKVIHTRKIDSFDGFFQDGDFHTSLMTRQLQDQLAKMHIYCKKNKWLLTEGSLINYAIKHPAQANYAYSMVGHCGTMDISFRECYDKEDFLLNLFWINKESGAEPLTRQDVKKKEKFITQFAAFSRIPSVGIKRAKLIFAMYPTVMEVLDHVDQLHEIMKIGKKTEDSIREWAINQVEVPD